MAQVIDFMNGTWARLAKVALGLALIAYGLTVLGTFGIILVTVGLVPLGLGLSGHCWLELFAGWHIRNPSGRSRTAQRGGA